MNVSIEQQPHEIALLLKHVKHYRKILEIGSRMGGVLLELHRVLAPEAELYSIDLGTDPEGNRGPHIDDLKQTIRALASSGRKIELKQGDSTSGECIEWARERAPFDFIFIDGAHTYHGVKADWENYGTMAKVIGFHDIRNPNLGVKQLWEEIRPHFDSIEWCQAGSIMGIGLVYRNGMQNAV